MIPKDESLGLIESCQVSTVNKSNFGNYPDHLTLEDGNDKCDRSYEPLLLPSGNRLSSVGT